MSHSDNRRLLPSETPDDRNQRLPFAEKEPEKRLALKLDLAPNPTENTNTASNTTAIAHPNDLPNEADLAGLPLATKPSTIPIAGKPPEIHQPQVNPAIGIAASLNKLAPQPSNLIKSQYLKSLNSEPLRKQPEVVQKSDQSWALPCLKTDPLPRKAWEGVLPLENASIQRYERTEQALTGISSHKVWNEPKEIQNAGFNSLGSLKGNEASITDSIRKVKFSEPQETSEVQYQTPQSRKPVFEKDFDPLQVTRRTTNAFDISITTDNPGSAFDHKHHTIPDHITEQSTPATKLPKVNSKNPLKILKKQQAFNKLNDLPGSIKSKAWDVLEFESKIMTEALFVAPPVPDIAKVFPSVVDLPKPPLIDSYVNNETMVLKIVSNRDSKWTFRHGKDEFHAEVHTSVLREAKQQHILFKPGSNVKVKVQVETKYFNHQLRSIQRTVISIYRI